MKNKKICIIGLGYIGLPTAAFLASRGFQVHGVDIIQDIVDTINRGEIHIVEKELDIIVKDTVDSGKLKADIRPIDSDIFIVAVPTPFSDGFIPNLNYVFSAIKSIAPFLKKGNIIIIESTSPVGTTDKIESQLKEYGVNTEALHIAYCPERVLPGNIMKELVSNDRIVGGTTPNATKIVTEFYRNLIDGEVLKTDAKTAEMAKLTENSFRDVNIAFANELSILCDKQNIDVLELIRLSNRHPRVDILQPGCGVGGHCIAVDPWFIIHSCGDDAKIIKAAREVNTYKTKWVIEKIKNTALSFEKDNLRKAKIACMGLSFKPNIDDLRESPAMFITKSLIDEGFDVLPVEPNVKNYDEFEIVEYDIALREADLVVYLVAHKEFVNNSINADLNFCNLL